MSSRAHKDPPPLGAHEVTSRPRSVRKQPPTNHLGAECRENASLGTKMAHLPPGWRETATFGAKMFCPPSYRPTPSRPGTPVIASLVLALALTPGAARAFEPEPTHPGLTARALLASHAHAFLKRACGHPQGLLEPLALDGRWIGSRAHARLLRNLARLDPAGGYRPDESGRQRAIGWIMAGSVLAEWPASLNRHHFYCPPLKSGLDNSTPLLGTLLALTATLEGADTVRQLLTGTGFDLTGQSALSWLRAKDNPRSVDRFFAELARSVSAPGAEERRHHLTLALINLGAVLHLLQDMASPTHVRNDFRVGHLQRMGESTFNRGSAFERYVADAYGQLALPDGKPVRRGRVEDFFSTKSWDGLADITTVHHFSPGSLPPPVRVLDATDPKELRQRLAGKLPLAKPTLGPLDLKCARRGTCHQKGAHGAALAYRIDEDQRLAFSLDSAVHRAAARHLLPLAVGYSTGLVDHLLRGTVTLTFEADKLVVQNGKAALASGECTVYWEDGKGKRTLLGQARLNRPVAPGQVLATLDSAPPEGATRLVALVVGRDAADEKLVAAGLLELTAAEAAKTK